MDCPYPGASGDPGSPQITYPSPRAADYLSCAGLFLFFSALLYRVYWLQEVTVTMLRLLSKYIFIIPYIKFYVNE